MKLYKKKEKYESYYFIKLNFLRVLQTRKQLPFVNNGIYTSFCYDPNAFMLIYLIKDLIYLHLDISLSA